MAVLRYDNGCNIVVTRFIEEQRDVVYKAYTDPVLIPQWWDTELLKTIVEKMEFKPGGFWRFIQRDLNGNEFAFHGFYHDIKQPEQYVSTYEYEGLPGRVLLETVKFDELPGGRTRLSDITEFQSVEDREAMLQLGIEDGTAKAMDRFIEILAGEKSK